MLLTKKSSNVQKSGAASFAAGMNAKLGTMDRRAFLRRSGMVAGAGAFASQLPFSMVKKAEAAAAAGTEGKMEIKRTICTHCSVGCAIDAVGRTASGCARSRYSIRRSTLVRIAPKVLRSVNTVMANIASSIR